MTTPQPAPAATYRVELANDIRAGRAIGNLWGVADYVGGCRRGYVLLPQASEVLARETCARLAADAAVGGSR